VNIKAFWTKNWQIILYLFISLSLTAGQFYLAKKAHLANIQLIGIAAFSLWILLIGIIDILFLSIPLWLTAPIIIAVLAWRFLDKTVYDDPLIGFGLNTFLTASGFAIGLIVTDLITHFGNWFAKYPNSMQGLVAIWLALPFMIVNSVIGESYPLWILFVILLVLRGLLQWAYTKNITFKNVLNWLCKKPWLAYSLLFVIMIASAYYNLYDIQKVTLLKGLRMNLVIFSLCFAFVIEEIVMPILAKFFKFKFEEEDSQTVLGGGDAMLNGAIGSLWGPIVVVNCLQMSFFAALLVLGPIKFVHWLRKKEADLNVLKGIPFAPFITFSAQIILLAEILVKLPK
jgi:hypothetical protein